MMSVLIFPWLQLSHDLSYWSPSLSLSTSISFIDGEYFCYFAKDFPPSLCHIVIVNQIKCYAMTSADQVKPQILTSPVFAHVRHYFLTFSLANLSSIIC